MAYLTVQSLVLGDEEIAAMRNASSTYMALLLFVVTLVFFALMLVFVAAANGEARSHRLLMTQHRLRLSRYALDAPCCERVGIERLNAELELAIERIDVRRASALHRSSAARRHGGAASPLPPRRCVPLSACSTPSASRTHRLRRCRSALPPSSPRVAPVRAFVS